MPSLTCRIQKEMTQMNLFINAKQKEPHRLRQRTYGCLEEEWGEEIVREFGINMYTLLYLKWITNKDLLLSVQFSCSVVSDSLQPHESQHARPPCPSPTPGVHSDSRPSSQ